ncbi:hypothetical protein [Streptomyces phaeoluteigriseus]|uniref:LexA family protein n=1 Tax=Streptomyces phaeoluteigriseus TaxID=114686 RepID=UPI00338FFD6D
MGNRRPEHLTERDEEILRLIRRSIQDRGEAMSLRELAREIGMRSTASVACHLANLEESGALVRDGRGAWARASWRSGWLALFTRTGSGSTSVERSLIVRSPERAGADSDVLGAGAR